MGDLAVAYRVERQEAYKKEEMLDGKIVMMSPRPAVNHGVVALNISRIFGNYLQDKPCSVFNDSMDVFLTDKDRVVPDVMIVCKKNIIKKNGIFGAPDLIVEVLSTATMKRDRGYKKNLYEQHGVKEYWLVNTDVDGGSIEVYLLKDGKYVLDDVYEFYPDFMLEDMTEEEKAEIVHEFKTSLFDDLVINIDKVFAKMHNL